ncbi:2-alkenal reductase [Longibacter salinarum]|uniref:2-alkenal reductase n=2 Tax=Longibacter salinarum TaxID=1850348 RepID=A0A2A8CU17_9BACT|nr:2-alkenal reductase [Longibacter salinarum]
MQGVRLLWGLVMVLLLAGCNSEVQSQEVSPPQRPAVSDTAAINQEIASSRQNAITRAVAAVSPAVVNVNVIEVRRVRDPMASFYDDPFFRNFLRRPRVREQQVESVGSGFIISPDGYVVTNDHVAGNATKIDVFLPDGQTLPAELVGSDAATDLALLKVEPEEALPYLAFDTTSTPIVGEWVIALGNPFGLFESAEPSVTVGVVSAKDRNLQSGRRGRLYRDMIQTDAAINRGNSGGPLVSATGEVIGVNTAIYSESGGSIGIGFAVPARKAFRIIEELRENGRVDRSYYTGLYLTTVTQRIANILELDRARGVLVRDIDPSSPADDAGLQAYDIIIGINGERIDTQDDYVARVYDYRPGDEIQMRVLRDGQTLTLPLRLGRQE